MPDWSVRVLWVRTLGFGKGMLAERAEILKGFRSRFLFKKAVCVRQGRVSKRMGSWLRDR